jgi:hypothetical protein
LDVGEKKKEKEKMQGLYIYGITNEQRKLLTEKNFTFIDEANGSVMVMGVTDGMLKQFQELHSILNSSTNPNQAVLSVNHITKDSYGDRNPNMVYKLKSGDAWKDAALGVLRMSKKSKQGKWK